MGKIDWNKPVKLEKRQLDMCLEWLISITEFVCLLMMILDCYTVLRQVQLPFNYFHSDIMVWGPVSCGVLIVLMILKDRNTLREIAKLGYLFLCDAVFIIVFTVVNLSGEKNSLFISFFIFYINEWIILFRIYRYFGTTFKLMYKLENIMVFLTVASVIIWFGAGVMNALGQDENVPLYWGEELCFVNYLNLCFRHVIPGELMKNFGLFTEPPMYGVFLTFGLYTELFLKKKSNPLIILVFAAGLFSCRAILAIMISAMGVGFKAMEFIEGKKYASPAAAAVLIVVAVIVIFLFVYKKNTGYGSLALHIDDFVACVKCWLHNNLVWGIGLGNDKPVEQYMSPFRSDNLGLSNSVGIVLAEGGIVLSVYYLLPFVILALQFFKGSKKLACWGIGMFCVYAVVIIFQSLFIFFLMAFGYSMLDIDRKGIRLLIPQDNISVMEGNAGKSGFYDRYFTRKLLDIPEGLLAVLAVIPVFTAVYSVFVEKKISPGSVMAMAVIVLLFMLTYAGEKKGMISEKKTWLTLCELVIWGVYLLFGHMYRTLDDILGRYNMLLQQSQWRFVIFVIITYAVVTGAEIFTAWKKAD